jgi:hypothetical protein
MNLRRLTLRRPALLLACVTLLAALTSQSSRAEIYKWVDKDGVTHYSDRPAPGATEITVAPAQTYQAPPPQSLPASSAASAAAPARSAKGACELRSPKSEEVLVNVPSITLSFRGPEGMSPVLMLNKKRYTAERDTNTIKVEPAPRGSYEADLTFVNDRNQVVCKVPTVTFYVRQPSVINSPARRKKPG